MSLAGLQRAYDRMEPDDSGAKATDRAMELVSPSGDMYPFEIGNYLEALAYIAAEEVDLLPITQALKDRKYEAVGKLIAEAISDYWWQKAMREE